MIKEFRLPDLGEGLTESEIVAWHVGVGDTVQLNQIIADVETAKAVVELPSPYAGVIKELYEQPGTVIAVGAPIVSFEVENDGDAPEDAPLAPSAGNDSEGTGEAPKRVPTLVGYGAEPETGERPRRRSRRSAEPQVPGRQEPRPEPVERPRSTPPVRKLARDLGIDLETVSGTGPDGLITRADVQAAQSGPADASGQAAQVSAGQGGPGAGVGDTPSSIIGAQPETQRFPIKGVRKFTAKAMVDSAFTAPHVSEFLTVDVTESMRLLERLKSSRAFAGVKLSPLALVAKALMLAVRRNPSVNSSWDEAAQEIVLHGPVNLGIAAATPRGLVVPNIKSADQLGLLDLAQAINALAEQARAGKTPPAELSGGTISITNIGVFGIDAGTPILNPGEAAILAMGAVRKMPWEFEGEVALRDVMTLSLSFDHRLVDGEQGSKFLADIGAVLRDPATVLTWV